MDLDIDSLVAVEIQTWFLKEVAVEIPVMRILGGNTITQICTTVAKKFLAVMSKIDKAEEYPKPAPRILHSSKESI